MIRVRINRDMLRRADERSDLLDGFEAALRAIDPAYLVSDAVSLSGDILTIDAHPCDLRGRHIHGLAIGKAAIPMAAALEAVLGRRLACGIALTPHGFGTALEIMEVLEAGHPFPDEASLRAAERIHRFSAARSSDDLVLVLLSGGGSPLLASPPHGVSLEDLSEITRMLHACGATIDELNTVRRHLSTLAGAQLLRRLVPATTVTLAISDVVGDRPEAIASGPTAPDPTTFADARTILSRHGLWHRAPSSIRDHVSAGLQGHVDETPDAGDPIFSTARFTLLATNQTAQDAVADSSGGHRVEYLASPVSGEAAEVGRTLADLAIETRQRISGPTILVGGGETTVTLRGAGTGGRNQEVALAAAIALDGMDGIIVGTLATDGVDGPTDAAGAVIDGTTCARARTLGLNPRDALERNDSYSILQATGDLLRTGPTRTNVADLVAIRLDP